jgi:LuxR family maltose regulon positive regulatory protein
LEKKQYLKLIGLSEQFLKAASIGPNLLCHIYLYIHLAAAYSGIFREADAIESLNKALELAMPDRLFIPFVENGEYIVDLLWNPELFGKYREEVTGIRRLHVAYQTCVDAIRSTYFKSPAAKLSEREEEVAIMAAQGLPNREISQRLFISENTVKAHLKSTFEKLSIKSRAQLGGYFK